MRLPARDAPEGANQTSEPSDELAASDPLGDKPTLGPAKPFQPPNVQVFETSGGIEVWLVEDHSLPLVAVTVITRAGSATDPVGKSGLAHITADMLDEGAGELSAVGLSTAVNDIGASLYVGATPEGSYAGVTSLKKHFKKAFGLLSDVVVRPALSAKEWDRVSELWRNALKKRSDDPSSVSGVVSNAAHYGPGTAYGRPTSGLVADSDDVTLEDVKAFYRQAWRPDDAVIVAVGDISRAEITDVIGSDLAAWKSGAAKARPTAKTEPAWKAPRVVLVDRPGAPQSVVAIIREGVKVTDPKTPLLELMNTALGGSFTSRLNQNLREEKNWTYGARSGFSELRDEGAFVARSAVETQFTGPALAEILKELESMAHSGLTAEELAKVKAQDRADLVETYGTVSGIAGRLGTLARLGLPPTFDATTSAARQRATLAALAPLAREHFDPTNATIVVVGPRDQVEPQLAKLGLPAPELWTSEGEPAPPPD